MSSATAIGLAPNVVAAPSSQPKELYDPSAATHRDTSTLDLDDFTNSSILEFLNKEHECFSNGEPAVDQDSEVDVDSLFEEINRLSDNTDDRSMEEILREAEMLISKQQPLLGSRVTATTTTTGHGAEDRIVVVNDRGSAGAVVVEVISEKGALAKDVDGDDDETVVVRERPQDFTRVVEAVCPDSVISEESTPKDMNSSDNDDSPTLDISDSIGTIFLHIDESSLNQAQDASAKILSPPVAKLQQSSRKNSFEPSFPRSSIPIPHAVDASPKQVAAAATTISNNKPTLINRVEDAASTTIVERVRSFCNRSTNSSPIHHSTVTHATTSPIDNFSISREYALKHEIETLQEKLKDTEERLQSLRIQHDSLSHVHRDLRENHTRAQEESELLKLDVQHLTECANILRSELQGARNDRNEAMDVQKLLQTELEESRAEKKKAQEQCEKDTKTIQDLQRQCREMERILMRKHPDSVSALIVASKSSGKGGDDNSASRRLLEQRIAQLESDAKEQDHKAQKILANVQARFNSVQSKYETHIADLETQVLSLQEINAKLNERIESQIKMYSRPCKDDSGLTTHSTQTDDLPERLVVTSTSSSQCNAADGATQTRNTSTQTDSSRPNSSTSSSKLPSKKIQMNKMSVSHSDTTISAYHAAAKEDAHLLATIRGMRIDLAIKDKAMQRLTRELDECKKTIKKLQREKDAMKLEKPSSASSSSTSASSSRKLYDPNQFAEHTAADSQALKEALSKIRLLENDYKALHDKRLQDLKTLQAAHERELASCQETVRVLQQRLTERDEAFAIQKRRKVPIDYYALKAKVSSLERRHSEREQRLHMLVEALSKGRLNGTLDEILTDNDQ